MFFII